LVTIDWSPKFATGLNMIIGCSSKIIWVIKLSFCQNDPLMGESFWRNNSLVTHILFELKPIIIFSPIANFGDQSLATQWIGFGFCLTNLKPISWGVSRQKGLIFMDDIKQITKVEAFLPWIESKMNAWTPKTLADILRAQFYIQLVFKAPLCITLTISDQKSWVLTYFFNFFQKNTQKKLFFSMRLLKCF
jgi:hypothetical protein